MGHAPLPLAPRRFLETARTDAWWLQPAVTFVVFSAFIVYATWAAYQGTNYHFGNYLSPFYSPELFGSSPHAIFGPQPGWWPTWLRFSPAALILWAPVGFRMTCYYYRGAYYKAFWADPVSCAVGEPRKSYWGEHTFPLIIQNAHRYMLPFAIALIAFLTHDAWKAMWFQDAAGVEHFGIGVGTIVLATNAVLLGGYTFGCHSLRHIVGGAWDVMSGKPIRKTAYACVSCLNRGHQNWAWCSLVWVGFSDVYVRLLAMGVWHDWRLI